MQEARFLCRLWGCLDSESPLRPARWVSAGSQDPAEQQGPFEDGFTAEVSRYMAYYIIVYMPASLSE